MSTDATIARAWAIDARTMVPLGIVCLPLLLTLLMAPASGGYFISTWGVASMVTLGVLAVVAVSPLAVSPGTPGWMAIGGFVGLAAWQGVSSAWASEPARAIENMNLTLFYGAAFTLVLVTMRERSWLRVLTAAALAVTAFICCIALLSRVAPGVVAGDEVARLSTWLSYWNALGLIAALGTVLSVGIAADQHVPDWAKCAAGALLPIFAVTLLATFSRGAMVAVIVGLAVLIGVAPGRVESVAFLVGGIAATTPVLVWLSDSSGLVALVGDVPPSEESVGAIIRLLVTMAGSSAIALAVSRGPTAALRRATVRRRVGITMGIAVAGPLVAWLVARPPAAGPIGWLPTQLTAFRSYDIGSRLSAPTVIDRLATAAGSGRWQNWQVAADQFSTGRLFGTGSGDFIFWWERTRPIDLKVVNAHSLYFEVLGDSGLLGLALLLVPGAVILFLSVRALSSRALPAGARPIGVALAACTVAAVHMAGDWAWQIPSALLPALVLGAGIIAASRGVGGRVGMGPATGMAIASLLAIVAIAGPVASARTANGARELAAGGDLANAAAAAEQAHAISPLNPEPLILLGEIRSDQRRPAEALAALSQAIALSPDRASVWGSAALVASDAGDASGARALVRRARERNPLDPRIRALTAALEQR